MKINYMELLMNRDFELFLMHWDLFILTKRVIKVNYNELLLIYTNYMLQAFEMIS